MCNVFMNKYMRWYDIDLKYHFYKLRLEFSTDYVFLPIIFYGKVHSLTLVK